MQYLYEFGDFRLDPADMTLTCGGESIALTPKVFEMLRIFVENAGRLVEKEELMQKIWAGSFVEESNLTFTVRQLRKALGDAVKNPVYIRTVPRHGYRFIAEVKKVRLANAADEPATPGAGKRSDKRDEKLGARFSSGFSGVSLPLIGLSIVLLSALAGAGSWFWRSFTAGSENAAPILAANFKSEKLTNTGGVYHAVISPDGKRMAYSSEIDKKQSIWIRHFETTENTQLLPNSEDFYYGLDFSHDGQTLYFARGDGDRKISLYRVPTLGGIPQEIASDTEGWFSLSPDDRQISFVRCETLRDDAHCALLIADADGQNERRLLSRRHPLRIGDNQFSPDGRRIAFAVGQSENASTEFALMEYDLAAGTEREITPRRFFNIRHLSWLSDESRILMTASELYELPNKIYEVSPRTGEVKALPRDSNYYNRLSLDEQAQKMVVTQFVSDFRLWLAPAADIGAARIVTYAQSGFVYTPSGKIVYGSMIDGNQNIWIMNGDGTNQRQLTNGQGASWQPVVSPDEQEIYFASNRSGSAQIWRMRIDGSRKTQISDGEGGKPIFVAPDGKTVYYVTSLTSKLRKINLGDDKVLSSEPISDEKVEEPAIDSNGQRAAYFSRRGEQAFEIVLMSLDDGKVFKSFSFAGETAVPLKILWSKDDRFLFYTMKSGTKTTFRKLSVESGKTEPVTEMHDHEVSDFGFSSNGETIAFICGRWKHDAYLIEGLK